MGLTQMALTQAALTQAALSQAAGTKQRIRVKRDSLMTTTGENL